MKNSTFIFGVLAQDSLHFSDTKIINSPGGAAYYSAIAASLYSKTTVGSIIGNDYPTKNIKLLEKKGVNTKYIQKSSKPSYRWSVSYSDDLANATVTERSTNAFGDLDIRKYKNIIKGYSTLYTSKIHPAKQLEILEFASPKTITIFETIPYWIINERKKILDCLKKVSVLVISDQEASILLKTNAPRPDLVEKVMNLGPKVVILKSGSHGISLYGKTGTFIVPSHPLTYAVDPTGAGPALGGTIAGILARSGKLDSKSMKLAVVLGSIVASFTVEGYGPSRLETLTRSEIVNRSRFFLGQLPQISDLENLLNNLKK